MKTRVTEQIKGAFFSGNLVVNKEHGDVVLVIGEAKADDMFQGVIIGSVDYKAYEANNLKPNLFMKGEYEQFLGKIVLSTVE